MTDPPRHDPLVSALQAIHPWDDHRVEVPGTKTTIASLRGELRSPVPGPGSELITLHRIARGLLALLDDLHNQAEQALWRFDPPTLFDSWIRTLGSTLTGFVMGVTADEVEAWTDPDSDSAFPAPQALDGVAFAQRIWAEMAHHLGDDDEARAWFLTSSPWLPDDMTPLQAIRDRDFAAVAHAANEHRRDESLRRPTTAERRRRQGKPAQVWIWGVWDAGDLITLHATERDAKHALEVRLHQELAKNPEDERLISKSLLVHPLRLHIDPSRRTPTSAPAQ